MGRRKPSPVHGVAIVDKPRGPTSHDVVARGRKAFGTRQVGHAGTLDPMATGVLVLAVGRATKLVPWLTAADKAYEATLKLGVATASLDADGEVVGEAAVPTLALEAVREVAARFVGTHPQRAPKVSAIKVGGERLHAKVRKGEAVEAPVREVRLDALEVLALDGDTLELRLRCGKGYYVRSLGRDLAEALGTVGHLTALRRTASGAFGLDEAVALAALGGPPGPPLLSLAEAAGRVLPRLEATEAAEGDARHGRPVDPAAVEGDVEAAESALVRGGELIAVVRPGERGLQVVRGFPRP